MNFNDILVAIDDFVWGVPIMVLFFWMLVAAFLGMATKYAEGFLAVKYRVTTPDGRKLGGPFYYIEKGMGTKWKWLAKAFTFLQCSLAHI